MSHTEYCYDNSVVLLCPFCSLKASVPVHCNCMENSNHHRGLEQKEDE